jgi:hypothetical protein
MKYLTMKIFPISRNSSKGSFSAGIFQFSIVLWYKAISLIH